MPVQVNIFLLLFGALQGVFLSLVLLQKKVHKNGYLFLVCYLFVMILQITLKVMSKVWLFTNLQPLYLLSYQFPFLYGPLIYLFVRQFLFRQAFRATDILHFLPFIIVVMGLVIALPFREPPLLLQLFFSSFSRLMLELISITLYHFLAWQLWLRHQTKSADFYPGRNKLQLKWLKQFIVISFIVCLFIAIIIFLMFQWYPYNQTIRFGFIALTVFIYWISYCAWSQPQTFSVVRGFADDTKDVPVIPNLTFYKRAQKYSNSRLSDEEMRRLALQVGQLMEQQKLYLDTEITIDKLADCLHCSKHHLSQVLNAGLNKSFYDFINLYRVEEAKLLLTDSSRAEHKIASIAYDAGFNSLSTFNDVFKKLTGSTPSQYRKQQAEQSQRQRV
jgi:AraC-like DNA-binding protein